MEENSSPINAINDTLPAEEPRQSAIPKFAQQSQISSEIILDRRKVPFNLYRNEHFLRRWTAIDIPTPDSFLYIVENEHNDIRLDRIISSPLNARFNRLSKRVMDIVISGVLIFALLSWMVPLIGLLIKLDSDGPIFFHQKRNKRDNKIFGCIKFRSMIINPDADLVAAADNDPRVTPFGLFLRKYHIDELPQLFNVFMGDMSIVGPRPHMITENVLHETLLTDYNRRHQVKPGITGLAQSKGYYGSTARFYQINGRLRLDKMYIRRWSVALDLKILVKTFRLLFIK